MSDAELVAQARTGDRYAFGILVERYQQVVFRTALVALRSRQEAEEVAQDALVSAFEKLGGFRGDASFKTWLLTITWNRAMDRRRWAVDWLRRFVAPDGDHADHASDEPSHETRLIAKETREEVRRLVIRLPARYREPLLLSVSGDHTFADIGRILGIPTGTAKWRAMEGRRLLKQRLLNRGIVTTA